MADIQSLVTDQINNTAGRVSASLSDFVPNSAENIVNGGINLAMSSILGGRSQGLGNTINKFLSKVTTALSPTRIIGNTYARQNVLDVMSSRSDPITNFDWIAVVVNKSVSLNTTLPWYYINNIQLPGPTLNSVEKYVDGRLKKYADLLTIDSATIKIYSDTTGVAFNFANDWMRAAYRDDNLYQLKSMYTKTIYVYILDSTRQIVVDIQLIDCTPASWSGYGLSSDASSALETSMTLNVDDFRVNYDSNPSSVIAGINKALGSAVGGITGQISSIASGVYSSATNAIRSALPF